MDDDWIAARYLLSSILGRNPLVVDTLDDESFPVDDRPTGRGGRAEAPAPAAWKSPPAVRAAPGVAGTVCAVCTDEIAVADYVVRLPCAHWYHAGCIAPWLGIRSTCPMCRAELPLREDPGEDGGVAREKPRREAGTSSIAGAGVRRDASSYGFRAAAGGVLSG